MKVPVVDLVAFDVLVLESWLVLKEVKKDNQDKKYVMTTELSCNDK